MSADGPFAQSVWRDTLPVEELFLMVKPPFRVLRPAALGAPIVVASPHSGRDYSRAFLASTLLDENSIRSSEDAYVDLLLDRVPRIGVPLLAAEAPRAYVDLNRAETEMDPALVQGVPKSGGNPRVSSGLGVIPRVVAQGRSIYSGKLSQAEAARRIDEVWRPYHAQLSRLMADAHRVFGRAILLDFHSMPHEAIENAAPKGRAPEIVLGDRFSASADPGLSEAVERIFVDLGFRVARNAPFAGAYIAQSYGAPARGRHVIQVEIDRALYMDEQRLKPSDQFETMRDLLTDAVRQVCDLTQGETRVAAE